MAQAKRKEKDLEDAPAGAAEAQEPAGWVTPGLPSRVTLGVIAGVIILFNLPLIHYFIFRGAPAVTAPMPYSNDFSDPDSIERDFFSTGGLWRVESGQLVSPGVKNNPLWLKASLPQNVAVEFDCRTMGSALGAGDIKAEIFGDGTDHASGYVLIHGGWNNTTSIIARLDEHAPALSTVPTGSFLPSTRVRVESSGFPAENGRTYHWRIERRGSLITWSIDGREFMRFDDPYPLTGKGHDRFAFSSWESQLYFDNLRIQPL